MRNRSLGALGCCYSTQWKGWDGSQMLATCCFFLTINIIFCQNKVLLEPKDVFWSVSVSPSSDDRSFHSVHHPQASGRSLPSSPPPPPFCQSWFFPRQQSAKGEHTVTLHQAEEGEEEEEERACVLFLCSAAVAVVVVVVVTKTFTSQSVQELGPGVEEVCMNRRFSSSWTRNLLEEHIQPEL